MVFRSEVVLIRWSYQLIGMELLLDAGAVLFVAQVAVFDAGQLLFGAGGAVFDARAGLLDARFLFAVSADLLGAQAAVLDAG